MTSQAVTERAGTNGAHQITSVELPGFLRTANQEYKAGNAHVFVLHGNVNDYQDNQGKLASLRQLMMAACDDYFTTELLERKGIDVQVQDTSQRGANRTTAGEGPKRICAIYVANEGLRFDSNESRKLFGEILQKEYQADLSAGKLRAELLTPFAFDAVIFTLSKWFEATKSIAGYNRQARAENKTLKQEAQLTVLFSDADGFFPSGEMTTLKNDKLPIIYMRNWAKDKEIGNRNRIFLITRHLSEIHESLRGGVSGISTILVPKPSLEDREEFARNFTSNLERRCAALKRMGDPLKIDGHEVTGVQYAKGFDHRGVAIQSAGMSRNQIEQAFNEALTKRIPLDDLLIRQVKQRCLKEEFDGVIEFEHPSVTFDQVGGLEELKVYARRKICSPLRSGDSRVCSRGVLQTGPAGTGKTLFAKALAFEAGVNFVMVDLSKLFNRHVGGTEELTAKMIEALYAAAPCIVFIDEIESALGGGRVTKGDSNTAGRMFNSVMSFLSDEGRTGKIVVLAATNRPDLLDPALIRAGRFDATLPALPPPQRGLEAVQGRNNILQALLRKYGVHFSAELQKTTDDIVGLGKLLSDDQHIWTGAEIEVVLKEAIDNAQSDGSNSEIALEHWHDAMESILPNTGDVERQIHLALFHVNNLKYCPAEWREMAKDKSHLLHLLRGGEDYKAALGN